MHSWLGAICHMEITRFKRDKLYRSDNDFVVTVSELTNWVVFTRFRMPAVKLGV